MKSKEVLKWYALRTARAIHKAFPGTGTPKYFGEFRYKDYNQTYTIAFPLFYLFVSYFLDGEYVLAAYTELSNSELNSVDLAFARAYDDQNPRVNLQVAIQDIKDALKQLQKNMESWETDNE
jgi:hypothetical protein